MDTTEESIVYQLLSTIRASELNNDEVITERRIRSYLRTHRAQFIDKLTLKGIQAFDEFFQELEIELSQINEFEWRASVSNIIQLPNNYGTKLMTSGFTNIPIVSEESYHLSKKHPINQYIPKAKIEHGTLLLRVPEASPLAMNGGAQAKNLVEFIKKNSNLISLKAILNNPDDGVGYDWTTSKYPCTNEAIQAIKESIWKKEFQIILQTKSDQVPNMKNDTLRYHDQGKVQR